MSTKKNFPYMIEHVISWARDSFESHFCEAPLSASQYFQEPHRYLERQCKQMRNRQESLRVLLSSINKLIDAQQKHTYAACVELARDLFQENFHDSMAQLLHSFPPDLITNSGRRFWKQGTKRCPQPIVFNSLDKLHINYIQSTANLYAHVFGVKPEANAQVVAQIADQITYPKFRARWTPYTNRPKHDSQTEYESDTEQVLDHLKKELSFKRLNGAKDYEWQLITYEKDDVMGDQNMHIRCSANLRALNYNIEAIEDYRVKMIAGRILPAVITSTAAIVGAAGIEIIKNILDVKGQYYRNSFANLAMPVLVFSEPLPPIENKDKQYDWIYMGPTKALPPKFTVWDKIDLKGPMTIAELNHRMVSEYNVNIVMVSCGKFNLFNSFAPAGAGRLNLSIEEAYEIAANKPYPTHRRALELQLCTEEVGTGIDTFLPTVRYHIQPKKPS